MSSKFKSWLRGNRKEDGQAMVMVALTLVVLLGFGAFAVDLGHVAVQKSDLQNAADAAALAGVAEISTDATKVTAQNKAVEYAKSNGMAVETNGVELNGEKVIATANVAKKQLTVECIRKVDYYFAGVLGFESTEVKAVAVAEQKPQWAGEALPFINIAFDYSTTDPIAWTKVGPGIKGTITDFYTRGSGVDTYFEVDYANGITVKPGFSNGEKGLDGTKLKDGLSLLLTRADENVEVVYLFSLRADIIKSGKFTVNNKTKTVYLNQLNKLNNGDVIDPYQLVVIKCLFLKVDNYNNQHSIDLKFLNDVYDLGNEGNDVSGNPLPTLPDVPSDFLHTSGNAAKLIK